MIFLITEFFYNFDPYNVWLAIATNIAVLLMTASVLRAHMCKSTHLWANKLYQQERSRNEWGKNNCDSAKIKYVSKYWM